MKEHSAAGSTWIYMHVAVAITLAVWLKLAMPAEEEDEQPGDYGRTAASPPPRPDGLTTAQRLYLDNFDATLIRSSTLARRLRRRFVVITAISITSAGAVPVAIAAGASPAVPAALGAAAAALQALEEVLKDQKRGLEWNLSAVALSRARRRLTYDISRLRSDDSRDIRFNTFVDEAEGLLSREFPDLKG